MQPSDARIAIINDLNLFHEEIPQRAKLIGSEVVASARTLQEANELIQNIGELGVNVILMDDSLTPAGGEGKRLTRQIQAAYPEVHIASISASPTMSNDLHIPYLSDGGFSAFELNEFIESL